MHKQTTNREAQTSQAEELYQLLSTWRQEQKKLANERREKIIIISLLIIVFFLIMPLMTRYI